MCWGRASVQPRFFAQRITSERLDQLTRRAYILSRVGRCEMMRFGAETWCHSTTRTLPCRVLTRDSALRFKRKGAEVLRVVTIENGLSEQPSGVVSRRSSPPVTADLGGRPTTDAKHVTLPACTRAGGVVAEA
jgi:hypothetical protein